VTAVVDARKIDPMNLCEHCGQSHGEPHVYCPTTGRLIPSRLLPEGTLLEGKYRIGRTVGVGGMGAVFEATHTLLEKRVAIKVILPGVGLDADQLAARLVQEARVASATGHRNIAAVTDMGRTSAGSLFVVMEYLEGKTLKEVLADGGPLTIPRAVALLQQVLSGLEAVHRRGIIHRDLKPENLMLVRDEAGEEAVKILDFGISKMTKSDQALNLTTTGLVMGTPQYMSPEQARGAPDIDHRTDLYSAGAILYLLVTGTPPFPGDSLNQIIAATLKGEIAPPSERSERVSSSLDAVILKAMALRREDRFRDARLFREALEPFLGEAAGTPASATASSVAPQGAIVFSDDLDEASLVALDEVGLTPGSRPGLAAPPSPKTAPPSVSAHAATAPHAVAPTPVVPPQRPPPPPAVTAPLRAVPSSVTPAKELDPAASQNDQRFRPPSEEVRSLDLDGDVATPAPRRATRKEAAREEPPAELSLAPVAQTPPDRIRTTAPYGQARKQGPPRLWLWVALGAAAALAGAYVLLSSPGSSGDRPQAETKAPIAKVTITFNVNPGWAEILVDGVTIPSKDVSLSVGREYTVTVKADGYFTQRLSVRPDKDQTLQIQLKKKGEK
jgi:serine/threonine-protein kinase